jgi:hypothetical protein
MIERRVDHLTRKRVAELSPEEMRLALLICDFSSFVMRFKHLLEPADNRVVWL